MLHSCFLNSIKFLARLALILRIYGAVNCSRLMSDMSEISGALSGILSES